jgi:hypothetical protein
MNSEPSYMPEDFEPEKVDEDIEWAYDETTDIEYLNAMCNAYGVADMVNPMTDKETTMKRRIMRKSLAVIDSVVNDIYKDFINRENETD